MPLAALLLLMALGTPPAPEIDAALRPALDALYDGGTDTALARFAELSAEAPGDPLPAYLEALALAWKIEQRPQSRALDDLLHARADRAIARADARLRVDVNDPRARLARGAAFGVHARLYLFRREQRESARAAVRMRRDLLALRELAPADLEVSFGLGLYDYYADVLPKLLKLLGFLTGIPGGDRARGLALIEQGTGAPLHGTEARVQLYEIYAFYERRPDRAHEAILALHRRYPSSPLWALKLAEHERARMGRCAESAALAREILARVESGHPNYQPVVGALARVSLGEALLCDLRTGEARHELLKVKDGTPELPALAAEARLLLGRSLEWEGDADGARAHYRLAAAHGSGELKRRAERALRDPLPPAAARALAAVGEARRLREAGRLEESAASYRRALASWPENREAALRVAEDELEQGRVRAARAALEDLTDEGTLDPPWITPWAWLLLGRAHDLAGEREAALRAYRRVWEAPLGSAELKRAASEGLGTPYGPGPTRARPSVYPK
jgi:tetratricopeptide (TPR) repeat protein